VLELIKTAAGVIRSLRIYYGDRKRAAAMDKIYAQFVNPGELVFDIGAHVGDRVASFRRLGARVVAAEPQRAIIAMLKLLYGRNPAVVIEPVAVGSHAGVTNLMINTVNPTVSTVSEAFIAAAQNAPGWNTQRWTKAVGVETTTLDLLIEKHGVPVFIKIDVEGLEAEVLAGLSRPVKALSFEFTTIQRQVAAACIERCIELGYVKFKGVIGESQVFSHDDWLNGVAIAAWLNGLPHSANSGDVYATF
jgi:FkbM family methyltransferase